MTDPDESTGEVIAEVFLCVLRPIRTAVGERWRQAGHHPAKLLLALLATVAWLAVAVLYAALALVVPLTYGLLLTISSPVIVGALLQRHRALRR